MTAAVAGSRADLEAAIARIVGERLRATAPIDPAAALVDLPEFNSVVLMDIVERLEEELETEIDPDLLVPETFESVRVLAGALWPRLSRNRHRP